MEEDKVGEMEGIKESENKPWKDTEKEARRRGTRQGRWEETMQETKHAGKEVGKGTGTKEGIEGREMEGKENA